MGLSPRTILFVNPERGSRIKAEVDGPLVERPISVSNRLHLKRDGDGECHACGLPTTAGNTWTDRDRWWQQHTYRCREEGALREETE